MHNSEFRCKRVWVILFLDQEIRTKLKIFAEDLWKVGQPQDIARSGLSLYIPEQILQKSNLDSNESESRSRYVSFLRRPWTLVQPT